MPGEPEPEPVDRKTGPDNKNPNRADPLMPGYSLLDRVPVEKVCTLLFETEVVHDERGRLVCPRVPAR